MYIPYGFDESNQQRRKRIYNNSLRTAKKLNLRLKQSIADIKSNNSLSMSQKKEIINQIFNGFSDPQGN